MKLSVVDIGWPGHIPNLVPMLERWGYHRYWTTEHYSTHQSASPVLAAALAASQTSVERLRIGTAGVLANFRSPASIAADFALLELFFPGRVDLGVAAATAGAGAMADALLDGRRCPERADYVARVAEVARLVERRDEPDPHGLLDEIGPRTPDHPQVWVCGTSAASADMAAALGLSYVFHDTLKDPDVDGPAIVDRYRQGFRPSAALAEPTCTLAAYGICADSERRALRLAGERTLAYRGRPEQCREQIEELTARYGTDELVTFAMTFDATHQFRSYAALAEVFDLA